MWPKSTCGAAIAEPAQHLADAAQAAAAQRRAGQVAVDRAEPERVERRDGGDVAASPSAAARSGWRARPSPASATQARADAPAPALTAAWSERCVSWCRNA